MWVIVYTFIEANLVSQYDHAFSEQLVLKVLSEEGAQLRLQQLPTKHKCTQVQTHTLSVIHLKHEPKLISCMDSCTG